MTQQNSLHSMNDILLSNKHLNAVYIQSMFFALDPNPTTYLVLLKFQMKIHSDSLNPEYRLQYLRNKQYFFLVIEY